MSWDPWQREVLEALGHRVYEAVAPSRLPATRDPLLLALLRAAGRGPDHDDAAGLLAAWPPAAALRGNAAAKRALWPTLRALRRVAGGGTTPR